MTAFPSSLRNGAAGEAIQPTLTECGKLLVSSLVTIELGATPLTVRNNDESNQKRRLPLFHRPVVYEIPVIQVYRVLLHFLSARCFNETLIYPSVVWIASSLQDSP